MIIFAALTYPLQFKFKICCAPGVPVVSPGFLCKHQWQRPLLLLFLDLIYFGHCTSNNCVSSFHRMSKKDLQSNSKTTSDQQENMPGSSSANQTQEVDISALLKCQQEEINKLKAAIEKKNDSTSDEDHRENALQQFQSWLGDQVAATTASSQDENSQSDGDTSANTMPLVINLEKQSPKASSQKLIETLTTAPHLKSLNLVVRLSVIGFVSFTLELKLEKC